MRTYHVTAEHGAKRGVWTFQCVEHPGALSEGALSEAPELMRETIAFVAGVPDDEIDVEVTALLPADVRERIEGYRTRKHRLEQDAAALGDYGAAMIAAMEGSGLTGRDAAAVLGVSPQRVSAMRSPRRKTPASTSPLKGAGGSVGLQSVPPLDAGS